MATFGSKSQHMQTNTEKFVGGSYENGRARLEPIVGLVPGQRFIRSIARDDG